MQYSHQWGESLLRQNFSKYSKILVAIFGILLLSSYSLAVTYDLNYDPNGNLQQDNNYYYEYNSFNQLSRIRSGTPTGTIISEFLYDQSGERLRKIDYLPNGSTEKTYYPVSGLIRTDNGTVQNTNFVYAGSTLVAQNESGIVTYYHPNHLGSTDIVTDGTGALIETTKYMPFGESISGGTGRFLFTGQEQDKKTGLYYFGARYYNPFLGIFIQPDALVPDIYDPQQFNRYSYAQNNPQKYIDADGNIPLVLAAALGGAIIGAGVSIIKQVATSGKVTSWSDVGKSAVVGAVGGFVGAATFGAGSSLIGAVGLSGARATVAEGVATITGSIVGGQGARATANIIQGNKATDGLGKKSDIAIDGTIGAVTFGLGKAYQGAYMKDKFISGTQGKSAESQLEHEYSTHVLDRSKISMSKFDYTKRSRDLYDLYAQDKLPEGATVDDITLVDKSKGIQIKMPATRKPTGGAYEPEKGVYYGFNAGRFGPQAFNYLGKTVYYIPSSDPFYYQYGFDPTWAFKWPGGGSPWTTTNWFKSLK